MHPYAAASGATGGGAADWEAPGALDKPFIAQYTWLISLATRPRHDAPQQCF